MVVDVYIRGTGGKCYFYSSSFPEALKLKHVYSMKEVQDGLAEHSVMTLASSPDNQPVMKMFLFAQEVSLINCF